MTFRNIYIFEEDGVFQACRDSKYKDRFAKEGDPVVVGVGHDSDDAVEELKIKEEVFICRPVNESREESPELICPDCGHHPLTLSGRKTLCMPKDRKTYCEMCTYECEF